MPSAKITTFVSVTIGVMTIQIISVGARPKPETASFIHDFLKRLPKHVRINWTFIAHGAGDPDISKRQESESILRKVTKPQQYVILLDENGAQVSSPELAKIVFSDAQREIVFVIGGAYGVTQTIRDRADMVWSLGKLVYPHQLVRVILAEQLYRAYCISIGHPYHHE